MSFDALLVKYVVVHLKSTSIAGTHTPLEMNGWSDGGALPFHLISNVFKPNLQLGAFLGIYYFQVLANIMKG